MCIYICVPTSVDEVSSQISKDIHIAVCIERLPVLTRSKTTLELEYEGLQEMLEFEHSSLSDYELARETMAMKRRQLKNDEDNEKLKKEVALLESEYQELRDIEEQHIKDLILASRTTEADKTNDKTTPYRKLQESLFLLSHDKTNQSGWQLPHGVVNSDTETLRQAAERVAIENVNQEATVHFFSNAPAGVYRKPEDGETGTAKVDMSGEPYLKNTNGICFSFRFSSTKRD